MSDEVASRPTYRVPRAGGMDPATKRLALIAAGLGGVLLVVLGAWSTLGVHPGPVPTIAAPSGPLRVKPDNPGGLKVANDLILSGGLSDAAGDKLAPAPETPDPQALKAPPPPAPTVAQPVSRAFPTPPTPSLAQPAAPPLPMATHAGTKPASFALPDAALAHGAQVQLAALPTRQRAEAEWQALARRDAQLLSGRAPSFSEVEVNGRTWWRVRTGGFADEAQARAFCEKLRATEGSACSVARF